MKKIALSILSAAVLAGCVDARHVKDPQGKDYLHVECTSLNAYKPVSAKCQTRLTKECPGGYTLVGATPAFGINGVTLVAKCDRDANNAQHNVSSFAAFAKINHVSETEAGLIPQEYKMDHSAAANNHAQPYAQYLPKEDVAAATTTEKTVTSNKNGTKEVTTVKKTKNVSKKDKKA